ncbi:hypothetical protein IWZ03DRAFT_114691 [Phyllosticta citriasiana]|uniref:Cell wall anchored protein n=1 Tax=Phyllosticta citriasiana TaxID=595635 RepID=A0ABR1KVU8_9PEZI
MARLLLRSLAFLAIATRSVSDAKDPINDFCRRWGHQTAVVDRRLYIDGGQITYNPMSENPLNYTNTWLLWQDLDHTNQGMPQIHNSLNKTSQIPDVSGGILWSDDVNKVLYLYGGEFETGSPESFTPWAYDIILDQWNKTSVDAASQIQRAAYGAGVSVNATGISYYYGGWFNNRSVPGWSGNPLATANIISYNMVADEWSNMTGPDSTGRAEGVMTYLPASDQGLLIYFGGVSDPYQNGTVVGENMSTIYIYDIASTKWYTQTASGDIPGMRRKFCGGATWADDHSSYNIYIYGGQGIDNVTGYDDVYILTLPSFQWIKWFPTEPGVGNPHGWSSCNVIDNSQMIIIGGWATLNENCDAPTIWGTHNLNLGEDGPQKAKWDLFYPNITSYDVPQDIVAAVGGGTGGGATVVKPNSWDNRDLPVYFTRTPSYPERSATRSIPASYTSTSTSTSSGKSSTNTGAIAGGVVGGVVALAAIVGLITFCLFRRRKQKAANAPEKAPIELPTNEQASELATYETYHDYPAAGGKPASPRSEEYSPIFGSGHSPVATIPPQTPYTPGGPQGYPPQYMVPVTPLSPNNQQKYFYPAGPPGAVPTAMYNPPSGAPYAAHPPPNAQPYDPSQDALHNQHFPRPPSPTQPMSFAHFQQQHRFGASGTPSDYGTSSSNSPDEYEVQPPTTSNTPAHFYPQPLQVTSAAAARQASTATTHVSGASDGGEGSGSGGVERGQGSQTPLVGKISGSVEKGVKSPMPVRGRFREGD